MTAALFAGREEREVLEVTFLDGRVLQGHYMSVARRHFIVCRGPGMPLHGHAEGPLGEETVRAVRVLRTRAEILQEGRDRMLGERIPGRDPVTREDYRYRLDVLAGAVQQHEDWQRQVQIRRQFDEVADRIQLAAGKRAWIHAEAKWRLRSNLPPTMADLWCADVASPSCFARPRPQDFDPDPAKRRRRGETPPEVRSDPYSVRNMLTAMKAAGLKARIDRLGDPPHAQGHILVKIPIVKGRSQFVAIGKPGIGSLMTWRLSWDGNDSKAGQRRYRAVIRTSDYALLVAVLQHGRSQVQRDLFV